VIGHIANAEQSLLDSSKLATEHATNQSTHPTSTISKLMMNDNNNESSDYMV
jgi:hypothetical protein